MFSRRDIIMLSLGFILALGSVRLNNNIISIDVSTNTTTTLPRLDKYSNNTASDLNKVQELFKVIQLNNRSDDDDLGLSPSLVQVVIPVHTNEDLSSILYSVTIESPGKYTGTAQLIGHSSDNTTKNELVYEWEPRFAGTYEVLVHRIVQNKTHQSRRSTLVHPSPFQISIVGESSRLSNILHLNNGTKNLVPCQLRKDRYVFSEWSGEWVGPLLNPDNAIRTGWSFLPSKKMNCVLDTYSQDDLYNIKEKKSIYILGSSVHRGIFLSLVDILLSVDEKKHFQESVVGKCWGRAIVNKGNLELMYQDFRTSLFGVKKGGRVGVNNFECHNDKIVVESGEQFYENATIVWEELFQDRKTWPTVVLSLAQSPNFAHIQSFVQIIPSSWNGTLFLVDGEFSAMQAGLVDQNKYDLYLKGLKGKIHRLDDDRVRWLDSIGLSKEMRMYSEYGPYRIGSSQHFHRFCEEDNGISICSNVTEMLGQLLLGHAIGPKALGDQLQHVDKQNKVDVVVCHACPDRLLPFHIVPRPNMTCVTGPFQARTQSDILAYEQRKCPQSCLKQQPNDTFYDKDIVQQRYCSASKESELSNRSATSPTATYIDKDGICVNDLPYAKLHHHEDLTEVERYQTLHIQRAGGDALEYGEIEPPELKTLPPLSSFSVWHCEKKDDCDLPVNSINNIKGSAWTADGKEAFAKHNQSDTHPSVIWVDHHKYEYLGTKNTTLKGDTAAMFGFYPINFGHVLHDNLPLLAFLKSVLPEHTTFALPDTKMYRNLINFIDPNFMDRLYFYQSNEIITVEDGTLTVANPKGGRFLGSYGNTLLRYMRHWIFDNHPATYSNDEKYLIFYSRGGPFTHHGRKLDPQHEQDVITLIKANMEKYHRNEKFIVFTGNDEEGNLLSYTDQFNLFRHASTIIGPHGSGLANVVWSNPFPESCDDRVHMLEFIAGTEAPKVQHPILFNGYFWVLRGMPVDWHQITYASNSTREVTFIQLDDLQRALDDIWGLQFVEMKIEEVNYSNNITCKWSPGKNDECIDLISAKIESSARRWLFFGDSTVFRLFDISSLSKVLIHSPLDKVRGQQCQLKCQRKRGECCKLNELFDFPYPEHWVPPNSSEVGLVGPHRFGAVNPYCCDCSGCFSDFLECDLMKNISADVSGCDGIRSGGFVHQEYARDIEIQTPTYLTTQENLVEYIGRVWNAPHLIAEYGKPMCVMSAGLHDAGIKDITTESYVQNVEFLLTLFHSVCDHIIWLGNTAPMSDDPSYRQTVSSTKSWNNAVMEFIVKEPRFYDGMSFVDVHEASISWPHEDHIHLDKEWYQQLGNDLFLPLIFSDTRDA